MFDGKVRQRNVSASISKKGQDKEEFVVATKKLREQREQERLRSKAAIRIQSYFRMLLSARALSLKLRDQFDNEKGKIENLKRLFSLKQMKFLVPKSTITFLMRLYIFFHSKNAILSGEETSNRSRFLNLFELVRESVSHNSADYNVLSTFNTEVEETIRQHRYVLSSFAYILCLQLINHDISTLQQKDILHTYDQLINISQNIIFLPSEPRVLDIIQRIELNNFMTLFTNRLCFQFKHIINIYRANPSQQQEQLLELFINHINKFFFLSSLNFNIPKNIHNTSTDIRKQVAWYQLTSHILSLPDLNQIRTMKPLLENLASNQGHGWHIVLQQAASTPTAALLSAVPSLPPSTPSSRGPYERKTRGSYSTTTSGSQKRPNSDLHGASTATSSSQKSSRPPRATVTSKQSQGDTQILQNIHLLGNFSTYLSQTFDTNFMFTSNPSTNTSTSGYSGDGRDGYSDGGGDGLTWLWLSLLSSSLEKIPLVTLIHYQETLGHLSASPQHQPPLTSPGASRRDSSEANLSTELLEEEEEEEASLYEKSAGGGGVKLLEVRVRAQQKLLIKKESQLWAGLTSNLSGLSEILHILTQEKIMRILFFTVFNDNNDNLNGDREEVMMSSEAIPMDVEGAPAAVSSSSPGRARSQARKEERVHMLLQLYSRILMSCPPQDLLQTTRSSGATPYGRSVASSILFAISFARHETSLVHKLWNILKNFNMQNLITFGQASTAVSSSISLSSKPSIGTLSSTAAPNQLTLSQGVLYLLSSALSYILLAIDDEEFFQEKKTLPVTEIRNLIGLLRDWLYRVLWIQSVLDASSNSYQSNSPELSLIQLQLVLSIVKLFNQLLHRNERRVFLGWDEWLWRGVSAEDIGLESIESPLQVTAAKKMNSKAKLVLSLIPQVIPFTQRVSIFQQLVAADKAALDPDGINAIRNRRIPARVKRDSIAHDAFAALQKEGKALKNRIQVSFITEQGTEEAGIDGGGLFKEFMDCLTKQAFDPEFGLFIVTPTQGLVPNPSSILSQAGDEHLEYYRFFGRILGKAMYERILIESQFAGVFLNALLGRQSSIDDLVYLDEQVYRSLMLLKKSVAEGTEISNLGIYFVANTEFGGQVYTTELIPGGSDIAVSRDNYITYMHLLANYKLNLETRQQSRAFLEGCRDIVPVDWLRMFGPHELQLLIGGDKRRIDVTDMKLNCRYAGGYHESQPYIQAFWDIVEEISTEEQSDLLKFVTSCSRQPLLGFGQLNPLFCIQKVPTHYPTDDENGPPRLPSAATCMNLLKLPQYESVKMLKEKLLYAIKSNSGFELS